MGTNILNGPIPLSASHSFDVTKLAMHDGAMRKWGDRAEVREVWVPGSDEEGYEFRTVPGKEARKLVMCDTALQAACFYVDRFMKVNEEQMILGSACRPGSELARQYEAHDAFRNAARAAGFLQSFLKGLNERISDGRIPVDAEQDADSLSMLEDCSRRTLASCACLWILGVERGYVCPKTRRYPADWISEPKRSDDFDPFTRSVAYAWIDKFERMSSGKGEGGPLDAVLCEGDKLMNCLKDGTVKPEPSDAERCLLTALVFERSHDWVSSAEELPFSIHGNPQKPMEMMKEALRQLGGEKELGPSEFRERALRNLGRGGILPLKSTRKPPPGKKAKNAGSPSP